MENIFLDSPLDMHLHIRTGQILKDVLYFSAKQFSGGLIMPNLQPPVTTIEQLENYLNEIETELKNIGFKNKFKPYMSIFFKNSFDFNFLKSIKDKILIVKLYPNGVTTNSEGGVLSVDLDEVGKTLEAMEKLNIPLSIHGETNGTVFEREAEFLPTYELLAKTFPKLKIIMEHISDNRTINLLDKYENLYATVSLHHLQLTFDDLLGGALKPHLFCKPIIKSKIDREALRNLVFSGNKKVMFGSDSAPHLREKKESNSGSAGIFSAPVLLPSIVELFERFDKLELLNGFLSQNAKAVYNIMPPVRKIELVRENWQVENQYGGIVPLFAGETLKWRVV